MPTKTTKRTGENSEEETNTAVYWLQKIYERVTSIEESHLTAINKLEKQISNLTEEFREFRGSRESSQPTVNIDTDTVQSGSKTNFLPNITNKKFEEYVRDRKHAYYNKIRSEGINNIYVGFLESNTP